MKKLGQEPAFPIVQVDDIGNYWDTHMGISKRFYAACVAMKGMLSNSTVVSGINSGDVVLITKASFFMADALLEEEAKQSEQ